MDLVTKRLEHAWLQWLAARSTPTSSDAVCVSTNLASDVEHPEGVQRAGGSSHNQVRDHRTSPHINAKMQQTLQCTIEQLCLARKPTDDQPVEASL